MRRSRRPRTTPRNRQGTCASLCPMALSTLLVCEVAVKFGRQYPRGRLFLNTTRGTPEALAQNFDIVIHPSPRRCPTRSGGPAIDPGALNLYASPQLLQGRETSGAPSALAEPDSVGWNSSESQTCWTLQDPQGRAEELRLSVRFVTDNLLAVKEAAIAVLGITRPPTALAAPSVAEGSLR